MNIYKYRRVEVSLAPSANLFGSPLFSGYNILSKIVDNQLCNS
jgi:hypothetical protein